MLRCPVCGRAPIFRAPYKIRHHCPACGAVFQREEGFFVGAIAVNVVTTELFILAVYLVCLMTVSFNEKLILSVLLPLALVFPLAFYHHSWSVWLSFDHLIEKLPKGGGTNGEG